MKRTLLLILAFGFIFAPNFSRAQTASLIDDTTGGVTITTLPEIPGANENISLTLTSSSIDLDSALITWKVNDVKMASKTGLKQFETKTGALGTATFISVSIESGSKVYQASTLLTPGSIDLLVQGRGYTPPFYKGRSLWASQGAVTVLALPHIIRGGKEITPSSLIYRWSKDGIILGNSSGIGKNSLSFASSILSLSTDISVDIFLDQNTVVATQSLSLAPETPGVLVYENSPLYGILFDRDVGDTFSTKAQEFSFTAIPLFFSGISKDASTLSYLWKTNANGSQTGSKVTYRTPDGTVGSSQINLAVSNTNKVIQSAGRSFLVQFGDQTNL
jgi:hypothetical protein